MMTRRSLVAIAVLSSAGDGGAGHFRRQRQPAAYRGNLSATTEEATWVLTSYLVANAIILPMSGWLANYFGRKRILLTVVTGFTASSLLCGLAPSLPMLIFFRVLQGITGGGLQPLSQAVLLEEFPLKSAAKQWRCSGWGSWPPRYSAPRWAGGSLTLIPGAGSSTSTCRSGSPA